MKKIILCLCFALGVFAHAEVREWTRAADSKILRAEFVRASGDKVTIRRASDRRVMTVDLSLFSKEDQEWVKAKLAEKEKGEEMTATEDFAMLLTGDWERTEGHGLQYRLFGERKMKRSTTGGYPLVIWLHGRNGNVMAPDQPGQARIFSQKDNFRKRPCFIIAPQNPDQQGWRGDSADGVVKIVKELVKNLPVDENRIYLAGYSMGGYGTFHLLAQEPKLFAAGVPIAGGGNPGTAKDIKKIPIWVFHGAKDPTVKVDQSQRMVEALKDAKGEVKYTEYPNGDHGIVGQVLQEKEHHEWLFEQSRE
ncbi:MAG: prolyl oligopeptidase family serine peptidase [Akkermansiaceae bacterium]